MKIKQSLLLTALTAITVGSSGYAVASSCAQGEGFFYCQTANKKKEVSVCATEQTAYYRFGPVGKAPEMALSLPRHRLQGYVWLGVGKDMTYSVEFYNQNITYEVGQYFERVTNDNDEVDVNTTGSIVVKEGADKVLAVIECSPETIRGSIESLDVKPTNNRL